jgi:hypothetical protein
MKKKLITVLAAAIIVSLIRFMELGIWQPIRLFICPIKRF